MVDEKQVLDGFFSGICCSMLVFGEAAHGLGIDEVTARKIASCFGSGMEHAGLCGCVPAARAAVAMYNKVYIVAIRFMWAVLLYLMM